MTYLEELAALKKQYPDPFTCDATYAYLDLHCRTAEALEKSDPLQAIEQYRLAEDRQSQVGSFASGSGEGLASMAELYQLMAKRAALEEKLANKSDIPAEALSRLENALAIWKEIGSDPNKWYGSLKPAPKITRLAKEVERLRKLG